MGSKHAGVHLRCDDNGEVIKKLKKNFKGKKGPSKKDMMAIKLIEAIARQNASSVTDPTEKAEKEAAIDDIIKEAYAEMGGGEPALVVSWEHFVSIFWYDHIRAENLRGETVEYAALCGVPAMGVSVYDDTNFSICAVKNAGKPDAVGFFGEYMFDYEDITPVKAEDICETVDAPFLLPALEKTLACTEGDIMAETFENAVGIPIFMSEEECAELGMRELFRSEGAVIFSSEREQKPS